jgi:arabinofuranosyltransferase
VEALREESAHSLRRVVYPALAVLVAGLALHTVFSREWGADDAFISFRYAKNLTDGHGLVFNPGERVEGYTNFLYVLILAAGAWLFHAPHLAVAVLVNVAALAAVLVVFTRHVDATVGREAARWSAVFVVLCPVFYRWVSAGLEAPLVLLLQLLLWVLAEQCVRAEAARIGQARRVAMLGAVTCLCVLIRADGAVFPIIAAFYLLLHARRREGLVVVAAVGLTLAAHVAGRLSYYGFPLPNTYYAKVSGPLSQRLAHGVGDLVEIGVTACLLPPVVAIAIASVAILRDARRGASRGLDALRQLPFESWMAAALLAFWVYVGGDVYEERFLLVLYLAGFLSLMRLLARVRPRLRAVGAAIFIGLQVLVVARFQYVLLPKYDQFLALGEFLRDRHPATSSIAIDGAGKVPYVTEMPTIDMLGLNDSFIGHKATSFFVVGHNKYDVAYVMSRHPDLIAAWLDLGATSLDLDWGLSESLYTRNGYRVRYLLNTNKLSNGHDVVDVAGYADAGIRWLAGAGYHYAVLERR